MPPAPDASSSRPVLPHAIAILADSGVQRSYRKKSILLYEGDPGDTLFVLLEGSVRVFGQDASGKEVTYGQIDAPSYFGEMSLDGGPRSASIEALTACTCAIVTRERIKAELTHNPELAFELINKIITRARAATHTVRSMALQTAYGRLRDTLQDLVAAQPDQAGIRWLKAGTTHAKLSQRIGTSREMVSKILRDLEKGGYLVSEGRSLGLAKKLPLEW